MIIDTIYTAVYHDNLPFIIVLIERLMIFLMILWRKIGYLTLTLVQSIFLTDDGSQPLIRCPADDDGFSDHGDFWWLNVGDNFQQIGDWILTIFGVISGRLKP